MEAERNGALTTFTWIKMKISLTFSRIDVNPWLVEHLLILPVLVPQNSFDTKKQNQSSAAVHQNGPGGPPSQADVQSPHPHCNQQAEAHAGNVQNSLCYHKAHIEKQVCGRKERDRQQAERERHHVSSGGQLSPALVIRFGAILCTIVVRVCVKTVQVFMIVPLVTVSVTVPISAVGAMMCCTVDVLGLVGLVCAQAEPSQ